MVWMLSEAASPVEAPLDPPHAAKTRESAKMTANAVPLSNILPRSCSEVRRESYGPVGGEKIVDGWLCFNKLGPC